MKSKKNKSKKTSNALTISGIILLVLITVIYYFFFTGMSKSGDEKYIYIDNDDTADSVYYKIKPIATAHSAWALRQVGTILAYNENVRSGRYAIGNEGALQTLRNLRNGRQAPIHLTIRSVRTLDDIADDASKKMSFSKKDFMNAVSNPDTCAKYGYTPETIMCMFIPNTYDFYWNTGIGEFLQKMKKESDKFWTSERKDKAEAAGLTPEQVMTIASIIAEETNNKDEKPTIAGIYINRLKINMPLQSCPTVKFAMKRFDLKRLYTSMLSYDSPYNTYKYKGLPPGPIRNPNIEDIDAVLNYKHHKYIYMCAKADFSGTHDFAETYEEHSANSKRYDEELNKRGIK